MKLFFELLKRIVGNQAQFSVAPSQKDWKQLFLFLRQQSLLGVAMPMLKTLPLKRKFKSYVGLQGAEQKLRKYLTDFKFVDVRTASKMIDWSRTPVIEL